MIDNQITTITGLWSATCDEAELSEVDRGYLWRRQFLNAYAFDGYVDEALGRV